MVFKQLLNDVYNGKDPNYEKLFKHIYQQLNKGILNGYNKSLKNISYKSPDFVMLNELSYNVGVFTAFKNHSKIMELVSILKNKNGELRTFREFKKEATKIIGTYNKRYLRVEYNQAVTSARAARKWQEIQRSKHLYPNLTYMSLQDDRTRPIHKAWHGITLPIDHPFWKTHYPPNDWECRCYVKKTNEPTYTKGYEVEQMPELPKQFNINTGIEGKVFSDKHPYFQTPYYKKIATFAKNSLVNHSKKQVLNFFKITGTNSKKFVSSLGVVRLTGTALNEIVNSFHSNAFMRNNLLFDIKQVLKDASFVKTVRETADPATKYRHYLLVETGKQSFYLNIKEMETGEKILYAITESIQ